MMCLIKIVSTVILIFLVLPGFGQVEISAPSWSPDGDSFTYISNITGNSEVYIYNFSQKTQTQLTFSDSSEWTPSWSYDGEKIAFISDRSGNKELYIYKLDDKTSIRLTNTDQMEVTPSWSPDSKRLFIVQFDPIKNTRKVVECDLDGNTSLIDLDSTKSYIYPRISKDRQSILMGVKSNNGKEFYHIAKAENGNRKIKILESIGLVSYNPSWSFNGHKILFINQNERSNTSASIYMMNSDGSDAQKVLSCAKGCFQARLSPDQKSILYKNGWGANNKGIYLYNLQTKENQLVISNNR